MKDENKFTVSIDTNNDKLCRSVFGFGRFDDIELKANSLAEIRDNDIVYRYNVGLVMGTCVNLEILFYQAVININSVGFSIHNNIYDAIMNLKETRGAKIKYGEEEIKIFIPELIDADECINEDVNFLFEKSCTYEKLSVKIY